jgi:dihydrolipoamide dehydrogenase
MTVTGDKMLLGVGRRLVAGDFALKKFGIEPVRGVVRVDDIMLTSVPDVYAAGDITGFSMLAP